MQMTLKYYVKFRIINNVELAMAVSKHEGCIGEVKTWMIYHKLKFNDSKTEFLPITTKYQSKWLVEQDLKLSIWKPRSNVHNQ